MNRAPIDAAIAFTAISLASCVGTNEAINLQKAFDIATQVVQIIPKLDDTAFKLYEAALSSCQLAPLENERLTCIDGVKEAGKPLIDALQVIRKAWCDAAPTSEGCAP